ncbi:MAG: hypothetical protein ACXVPU_07165 [Bacteroidia bacterium]
MKRKIVAIITAVIAASTAFAQTTDTLTSKSHQDQVNNQKDTTTRKKDLTKTKKISYCCPKCDFCDTKTGKCPNHGIPLVMEGTYYCQSCYTLGDRYGMCPVCGNDMKIIDCKNVISGKD